jgi:hypothetical protein
VAERERVHPLSTLDILWTRSIPPWSEDHGVVVLTVDGERKINEKLGHDTCIRWT